MSTATAPQRCAPGTREGSLFEDVVGGEPTLEELIASVWEGLAVHGTAPCPACGATMQARYGAHSRPVDGCCAECGATVS